MEIRKSGLDKTRKLPGNTEGLAAMHHILVQCILLYESNIKVFTSVCLQLIYIYESPLKVVITLFLPFHFFVFFFSPFLLFASISFLFLTHTYSPFSAPTITSPSSTHKPLGPPTSPHPNLHPSHKERKKEKVRAVNY